MTTTPETVAGRLLGRRPVAVTPVSGGGNSRIFRLDFPHERLALKFYPADERDRLGAEFGALSFLRAHDVACVPAAIAADVHGRVAAYEWVDGERPEALTEADFDAVFTLLARLRAMAGAAGAVALAPASAACLVPADAYRQLDVRVGRLAPYAARHPDLAAFLDGDLLPGIARMREQSRRHLVAGGIDPDRPILRPFLSPSDFGRHNMLRRADGRLAFLDFEYFGWDDPVKAISDFVLHPGSGFGSATRDALLRRATDLFGGDDASFALRLRAMFGVYGMIWCLILLNEFIPATWKRRALTGEGDVHAAQRRQLAKAQALFRQLRDG